METASLKCETGAGSAKTKSETMHSYNNIAAQNQREADRMRQLTLRFRSREFPEAVYSFLSSMGVDSSQSVVLHASRDEQGTNPFVGLILSQDGRFFELDIDCDLSGSKVIEELMWIDVTEGQNLRESNRGFGKGTGFIALEVQHELRGHPFRH